jgi:hypothetical protein
MRARTRGGCLVLPPHSAIVTEENLNELHSPPEIAVAIYCSNSPISMKSHDAI